MTIIGDLQPGDRFLLECQRDSFKVKTQKYCHVTTPFDREGFYIRGDDRVHSILPREIRVGDKVLQLFPRHKEFRDLHWEVVAIKDDLLVLWQSSKVSSDFCRPMDARLVSSV